MMETPRKRLEGNARMTYLPVFSGHPTSPQSALLREEYLARFMPTLAEREGRRAAGFMHQGSGVQVKQSIRAVKILALAEAIRDHGPLIGMDDVAYHTNTEMQAARGYIEELIAQGLVTVTWIRSPKGRQRCQQFTWAGA